jgi:hypothetical protein
VDELFEKSMGYKHRKKMQLYVNIKENAVAEHWWLTPIILATLGVWGKLTLMGLGGKHGERMDHTLWLSVASAKVEVEKQLRSDQF